MRWTAILCAAAGAAAASGGAMAQPVAKDLFREHCSACHAPYEVAESAPASADTFRRFHSTRKAPAFTGSDEELQAILTWLSAQ